MNASANPRRHRMLVPRPTNAPARQNLPRVSPGVVIVTGSSGLVGAAAVRRFDALGHRVIGIDNDLRSYFFGSGASTSWSTSQLREDLPGYDHRAIDIRDERAIDAVFAQFGTDIQAVIHCAGQPSHDWATREPHTDFSVNATGTLVLLEATRKRCPKAAFVFTSTNKVYGDTPNRLPMVETETRWELDPLHPFAEHGIDESMSIDQSMHSLFGASKLAADVMVQEYGRYFGMRTGVFRGGCLTGPGHAGAELHGFLAWLMKCARDGIPYVVHGHGGKQVRDNIHADDLVACFEHFVRSPRCGEVYNIGGGRFSNCSMQEAITMCETIAGKQLERTYAETERQGDHRWWISDTRKFRSHYPAWRPRHGLRETLTQIHAELSRRSLGDRVESVAR